MLENFKSLSIIPMNNIEMLEEAISLARLQNLQTKRIDVENDKRISKTKFNAVVLPNIDLDLNIVGMKRIINHSTMFSMTDIKSFYTPRKFRTRVQSRPLFVNINNKKIYDVVRNEIPEITYYYMNVQQYQYKNMFYDTSTFMKRVFEMLKVNRDDAIDTFVDAYNKLLTLLPNRYHRIMLFDLDMDKIPYRTINQIKDYSKKNDRSLLAYLLISFKYNGLKNTLKKLIGDNNSDVTMVFVTKNGVMKLNCKEIIDQINNVLKERITKLPVGKKMTVEELNDKIKDETDKALEQKLINKLLLKAITLRAENLEQVMKEVAEDGEEAIEISDDEMNEIKHDLDYMEKSKTVMGKIDNVVEKSLSAVVNDDVPVSKVIEILNTNKNIIKKSKTVSPEVEKELNDTTKKIIMDAKEKQYGYEEIKENNRLRTLKNRYGDGMFYTAHRSIEDEEENAKDTMIEESVFDVDTPFGLAKSKFVNFDKEYEAKTKHKDIMRSVLHLATSDDAPLYLDKVEVKDKSTKFDLVDNYAFTFTDDSGESHNINIDVPKMYRGNFLYMNGGKKVVTKMIKSNPITKIGNRVRFSTDYKKIFFELQGSKYATYEESILIRGLSSLSEPMDHFDLGNVFNDNDSIPTELQNISKLLVGYSNTNVNLSFSNLQVKDDLIHLGVFEGEPVEFDLVTGKVRTKANGETVYTSLSSFILSIIKLDEPEVFEKYFEKVTSVPKHFLGSYISILSHSVPVILIAMYTDGFLKTMEVGDIPYDIIKKTEGMTKPKYDPTKEFLIELADSYIKIHIPSASEMALVAPLSKISLLEYTFDDLMNKDIITEIINEYVGSNNFAAYIDNFKFGMLDPKTVEILSDFNQPTEWLNILLYCHSLLVFGVSTVDTDLSQCRISSADMITSIMYGCLMTAYDEYRLKVKRGSKNAKLTISPKCVINAIGALPNTKEYSEVNPIAESLETHSVTLKGYGGINVSEAYDIKKRMYNPTYVGNISTVSAYGATIGVVNHLCVEPNIKSTRGYMKIVGKDEELDNLNMNNLVSVSDMATVGSASHDDPPRDAMAMMQNGHLYATLNGSVSCLSTGYDEVMAYQSADFARRAKKNGVVTEINSNYVVIKYEDGEVEPFPLNTISRDSSKSSYNMNTHVIKSGIKVGKKVSADDLITYNNKFFKEFDGKVVFMQGPVLTVAVTSDIGCYEDATVVSEDASTMLTARKTKDKTFILNIKDKILEAKTDLDHISINDTIIKYIKATDSDLINQLGDDTSSDLNTHTKVSDKSGDIVAIQIYICGDNKDMTPSVKKFVNTVNTNMIDKYQLDTLDQATTPESKIDDYRVTKVPQGTKVGGYILNSGDMLIRYFIDAVDRYGVGDKLTYHTALKGVCSEVRANEKMPITYDSKMPIDCILSTFGVNARMVVSEMNLGLITRIIEKIMPEYRARLKTPNKKVIAEIKSEILELLDIIDPSKTNSNIYVDKFNNMSDIEFVKYINTCFIRVYTQSFSESDILLDNVKKACDKVGIKPSEKLILRNMTEFTGGQNIVTEHEQFILRLPVKRLRQFSNSENFSTSETEKVNKVGQVVGDSKGSSISDLEVAALTAKGYHYAQTELLTVRSDNKIAPDFIDNIVNNGESDYPKEALNPENKVALGYLDALYLAAGISTNFIEDLDKR